MDFQKAYDAIKKRDINKVAVFGTGSFWRDAAAYFNTYLYDAESHIDFYIDNDKAKWGTYLNGKKVVSPEELMPTDKENVIVFVASSYYDEISSQLNGYGLIENYHYVKDFKLFIDIIRNIRCKKELLKFKDIHKGKRAFLIGNGPSLRINDLDRLKNEITFACNKIYLAFDQTEWRPTYFVSMDTVFIDNNYDTIEALNIKKFLPEYSKKYFKNMRNDCSYLIHLNSVNECDFSTDCVEGVYGGWTVVYTMLQIAFYMGITEVCLLGVDYKFNIPKPTGEISEYGEIILRSQGEENHFHKDYRKAGESWTIPQLDKQYLAFSCAREAYERDNRRIYNASRETELDVYPTVDFDNIIR